MGVACTILLLRAHMSHGASCVKHCTSFPLARRVWQPLTLPELACEPDQGALLPEELRVRHGLRDLAAQLAAGGEEQRRGHDLGYVLEFSLDTLNRGALIQWLSQYPGESLVHFFLLNALFSPSFYELPCWNVLQVKLRSCLRP